MCPVGIDVGLVGVRQASSVCLFSSTLQSTDMSQRLMNSRIEMKREKDKTIQMYTGKMSKMLGLSVRYGSYTHPVQVGFRGESYVDDVAYMLRRKQDAGLSTL